MSEPKADSERILIRALLVEDSPAQAELIKSILKQAKRYSVQIDHVLSLEEAEPLLAEKDFDIALLDLGLKESSGLKTLELFIPLAKGIPIVVQTAVEDESAAIEALRRGAQDYIVKGDFDSKILIRSIRYAIERRHLEDQLHDAQKMEAIGRLAGGVAHDFNNLLTVIRGFADLRVKTLPKDEPIRADFIEIQKAAQQAATITNQLLAFSRKQMIRAEVLGMNALIEGIRNWVRSVVGSRITLALDLDEQELYVKVDKVQMDQVFLNLILNAKDAIEGDGKITIETRRVEIDQKFAGEHDGFTPGPYAVIHFKDTGHGMPKDILTRVFEPFFTTKGKGKGVGLGLATSYGTIRQLGGQVLAESHPGQGSVFSIYLPETKERPEVTEQDSRAMSGSKVSARIFLVEDEEMVRDLLSRILKDEGFEVVTASSGLNALDQCKKNKVDHIDLLLTDVVMPKMGGPELVEALRPMFGDMKVLYMSGYTDAEIVEDGALVAGVEFIQKPFSPDELVEKVKSVIHEASSP